MRPRSCLAATALLTVLGCGDDTTAPGEPATAIPVPVPEAAVISNTWIMRANMPSDRWNVATATFPNRIGGASLYTIGGTNANGSPLGKVQVYDPATNTWTTKASLPHVVGYGNNGAVVIDSLVYVPGGLNHWYSMRYLQVYNAKTNTWVDKAPRPLMGGGPDGGLSFGVSGAINGKLYVLGHFVAASDEGPAFLRYNPATDTWAFLPLPPFVPFRSGAAGVLNKKLYVEDNGALEVYDPVTNQWTRKAPMPTRRTGSAFAAVNNKLYIVGGWNGTTWVGRVDVYDPTTNAWTKKASIPRVERGLSGGRVVVSGQARLEVVGGARPGNNLQYIP